MKLRLLALSLGARFLPVVGDTTKVFSEVDSWTGCGFSLGALFSVVSMVPFVGKDEKVLLSFSSMLGDRSSCFSST